jgi:long-subunit acyl-CoA synthetase (AMP-forming)
MKLLHDMVILKPTIFTGVPKILNMIFAIIKKRISDYNGIDRWLCENAIESKI